MNWIEIFLNPPITYSICLNLAYNDIINLYTVCGEKPLNCLVPITDTDNIISYLNNATRQTLSLCNYIFEYGSNQALIELIKCNQFDSIKILLDLGVNQIYMINW